MLKASVAKRPEASLHELTEAFRTRTRLLEMVKYPDGSTCVKIFLSFCQPTRYLTRADRWLPLNVYQIGLNRGLLSKDRAGRFANV
jgi:hypothetical protein